MRITRFIVLAGAVMTAAACSDRGLTAPLDLAELVPAGGTQVVLQEEAGAEPGTLTYVVRVITRRSDLGAYQGEVRFAPGAFTLVEAVTPAGGEGEMHVINPEVAAGRIRFAAYATEAFAGTEAFRFTVRPLVSREDAQMRASLTVAGVVTGAALESAQLIASDGIRDSRGHLILK